MARSLGTVVDRIFYEKLRAYEIEVLDIMGEKRKKKDTETDEEYSESMKRAGNQQ